jgi:hypothetical protein
MELVELIIASSGSATFIASTVFILLKHHKREIDSRLDSIMHDIVSLRTDLKERIDLFSTHNTEVKVEIAKLSSAVEILRKDK